MYIYIYIDLYTIVNIHNMLIVSKYNTNIYIEYNNSTLYHTYHATDAAVQY